MKRAYRSSLFGFVTTGAIVVACGGATTSSEPADAGVDAEVAPDTSVPMLDADTKDAAGDARDPGDAMVDAADPGDAMVDAADPGDAMADAADASVDATSDAGTLPPALFMPGESGALYEMRAVCRIEAAKRAYGLSSDGCCAYNNASVTTTCETMLREEPDGAGSLRVVIDRLQGCTTEQTTPSCRISQQSSPLPHPRPCFCNNVDAVVGSPLRGGYKGFDYRVPRLDGYYARRFRRVGTSTVPVSHYWIPGCPYQTIGELGGNGGYWGSCTSPDKRGPGYVLRTLERTGEGKFTIHVTWSFPQPQSCLGPDVVAPLTLDKPYFSTGGFESTNFETQRFQCTYTLTKK